MSNNDSIYDGVCDDALGRFDATALAERIARGDVSAEQVMDAAIDRLQAAEPVLHATVCQRLDAAREEAKAMRQGISRRSPFAGVPSFIKDNLDLAGLPTRHGSRAVPVKPAPITGAFAQQMLATGVIALGKTKLPEFGIPPTVEFMDAEPARNPWHTGYSTGGSSGGSAALVAAGVVPIAHGNDGGGSIRIPASCCGLVGLKGTRGRVRANEMASGLPIDIISDGVLSRTVRDTAAFFAAAERSYRDPELPEIGYVEGPGTQKLRIGVTGALPDGGNAHPACLAAMNRAAHLCEQLGHHVEEMDSPLSSQMGDDFMLYYAMICAGLAHAGRFTIGRGFKADRLEPLTLNLARHFRRNIWKFPAALWRLKKGLKTWQELTAGYDMMLSPTLGQPPPPLGYLGPDLPFEDAWRRLRDYAAFTPAANIAGTPAISLPMSISDQGLPIGVHLAAGPGEERQLLEMAYALEDASGWPHTPTAGLA